MTEKDIEVTAQPTGHTLIARFPVNRPLIEEGVFFPAKDAAAGSPLAEKLFAMPGVEHVKIAKTGVTVKREGPDGWDKETAFKFRDAILEHAKSGTPAVKEGLKGNIPPAEEIRERAEKVLAEKVNPAVAGHGGKISITDVKDANVYVRLEGGCQGCAMAQMTLRQGVEAALRDSIPEIDEVLDSTDHASGQNPHC